MALDPTALRRSPAYAAGAAALVIALAAIVAALGFEHIGGYSPCPLCLEQRYAYYAGVPLLFVALVATSAHWHRLAQALFLLVACAFLVNAGLGAYQSGAEWKYWPGPTECSGGQALATTAGGLLEKVAKTHVIRCDEAAGRFAGLSFAGWNAIASLLITALGITAARRVR